VLPPERVVDPDRRRRFVQEARAASALNHPNIITIHDIDEAQGVHFIAMEYVQGKTLDRLIARHGLRVDEALKYAVQMATALAKAHSAGIVHRDLKPTNVMVTDDGLVKVLDFGLAKLTEPAPTGEAETAATWGWVTEEGTIVGTVGYMSPEQAEGKRVDARSDTFSFGSVLYEMLTGARAFQGETKASTIAAILREEPKPLGQVVEGLPHELERMVKRCLRKDREHRFQTMADLKVALEELKEELGSGELAEAVGAGLAHPRKGSSQMGLTPALLPAKRRKRLLWTLAIVCVALGAAALGVLVLTDLSRPRGPTIGPVRFQIPPPENMSLGPDPADPEFAVSPDGRMVAFAATNERSESSLWIRPLGSAASQRLSGTEGAHHPFWSPDSQNIAFFAAGKLKKIAIAGGSPLTICEEADDRGTWGPDGTIVFKRGLTLWRVPAAGGNPTGVTKIDIREGQWFHVCPQFLPDGGRFLYFASAYVRGKSAVYIQSLDSNERTVLLNTERCAAFVPSGYVLFVRNDALLAQRLDIEHGRLVAEPSLVVAQVNNSIADGTAAFSVSSNGVLAYRSGSKADVARLAWYDRKGKHLKSVGEAGPGGKSPCRRMRNV